MVMNVKILIIMLLSLFAIVGCGRGGGSRGRRIGSARGGFRYPIVSVPLHLRPSSG